MKTENFVSFGKRLKALREMKNLSRKELALMIKVSEMTIHRWETDKTTPKLEDLKALALALGVSEEILTGKINTMMATNIIKTRIERLPDEAIEELNTFLDYLTIKYSKKKRE